MGHTITNNYEERSASLDIKKYIIVPKGQETYPAITMVLTRSYIKSDGSISDSDTIRTIIWGSSGVKEAVNAVQGDGNVTAEYVFSFENLPVYAPNGSRYIYCNRR